jgi:tRNA dimethylallyltransferase
MRSIDGQLDQSNEWMAHDKQLALECWFLTGPTASGKTAVGMELAQRIGAEIISLDSMAVYRGMDIGTAKPTPDQRALVQHHLIDLVEPEVEFNVFQYFETAARVVSEIRGRNRQVLFVGGTPMYLKALLRGLMDGPGADWTFRHQAEADLRTAGRDVLYERLKQMDPQTAARLHPHDTRRIIRAMEVHALAQRPLSHWQTQFGKEHPADACRVFALQWAKDELHQRIDRRVDAMFAEGLVDEVRRLTAHGRYLGRTACQAVGYREVMEYLRDANDLDQTRALVKTRTRQFAKRQGTWFRSLAECRPVAIEGRMSAEEVAECIHHAVG